jgi:hypothetical protein
MRNYKEDIKIDNNKLEEEWTEQASMYQYYAEDYADAVKKRDKAKSWLEVVHAKVDSIIRKDKNKKFDKKPTEGQVKSLIITHPKYKQAQTELIDATYEMNLALGIKTSFEHRKKALENIVSLHITGFHAEPRNKIKDTRRQVARGEKK